MAINLSCYTTKEASEILAINTEIANNDILFIENRFLLYNPRFVNDIELEIASEFNFFPKNKFLIALNDKDYSGKIGEVSDVFFDKYGDDILILFENETKVEKGKW